MYDALLEKVRRIHPNALSDQDIIGFFDEAIAKACPDENDYGSGEYLNDVLLFYALAQISLYSNDIASYGNYYVLYNNAAQEFSRRSFQPDEEHDRYSNMG